MYIYINNDVTTRTQTWQRCTLKTNVLKTIYNEFSLFTALNMLFSKTLQLEALRLINRLHLTWIMWMTFACTRFIRGVITDLRSANPYNFFLATLDLASRAAQSYYLKIEQKVIMRKCERNWWGQERGGQGGRTQRGSQTLLVRVLAAGHVPITSWIFPALVPPWLPWQRAPSQHPSCIITTTPASKMH